MKQLLVFSLAVAALSAPAFSADFTEAAPAPYDWTGFYAGIHAGYGTSDVNGDFDIGGGAGDFLTDGNGRFSLDPSGFLAGGQLGYNWQSGSLVLGAEADASFVDWDDTLTNGDNEVVSSDASLLATLRARAGFAADRLLIYGTAGGAFTNTEFTATDINDGGSGSVDLNDLGLVVGGGAEWAFTDSLSMKVEGLFFKFNERADTSTLTNDSDAGDFARLDDAWLVRAGLNWHF